MCAPSRQRISSFSREVRGVGWPTSFHYLAAVCCLLVACDRPRSREKALPSATASSTGVPIAPLISRELGGEAAFDLVTTAEGAALAWGRPARDGAKLTVALLDANGEAKGEPLAIAGSDASSIVEVSAASVAGRIGVAWVARAGEDAASFGALGDPATRSFGAASPLGDASLGDPSQRGHLAVASSDRGELVVLRRGRDEACQTERGHTCASFAFRELTGTGPVPRGLPLAVPASCGRALVGFGLVKERWHYAVCSELDGHPATTTVNIQPRPFYAEAKKVLEGCSPLGAVALGDDFVVVGECADGRRGVRFAGMNTPPRELDLSKTTLACERGRPVLRAPGDVPLGLVLDVPRDGLAPLLPLAYAPANARAVWTGSSLLVASFVKRTLMLRRYACSGGELVLNG